MAVDSADLATARDLTARADRIMARLAVLAGRTEEPGCITRPYGSAALRAAMDDVAGWMTAAGLDVHRDAVGSLRGLYPGRDARAAALLLGSHLDSVRNAGRFDGPLGVVAALDIVEQLVRSGQTPPFPIEVLAFADEEGMRYQTAYLGSRAIAGAFDASLLELQDDAGVTLREAMSAFGGDPAGIDACALCAGEARAYVELHIEQGPLLESLDVPVGVVTGIAGATRVAVAITGEAGHAGTVPPHLRRDALPAAAELVLAAERAACQTEGLVATVGQLSVDPGVSNVIPARARLSLDVRHQDDAVRRAVVADLAAFARETSTQRSLELEWRIALEEASVRCDPELIARLSAAIAECGLPVVQLASGAGHDAVMLSRVVPVAMLFVRCRGGISHHPDESVAREDIAVALDVLDRFLVSYGVECTA